MRRASAVSTLALLALLAASVAIRAPFFSVPMISDEGGYAYVARFWTGDYQLYRDIPFDRPQGIFLIYKAILATVGTDVIAIRLAAALYNALTTAALFCLARAVVAPRGAWWAAGAFALFSTSPRIEGFTANAELFTLLPLVVAAHLTWRERWGWAGFVSGVAVLVKPSGVAGLLLTLGWLLVVRGSWRAAVRTLGGFSVAPLAGLAHGLWIGWEHVAASYEARRAYNLSVWGDPGFQLRQVAGSALATAPVWIAPAVLAGVAAFRSAGRVRAFGFLWLAVSFAGPALGGNWFPHYYVQLIPPLALLAGAGMVALSGAWRVPVGLATALFLVVEGPWWFTAPRDVSWKLYTRAGYLAADAIAAHVAARTRPDDPIYVAFAEAEIYYLAGRRAAVPQLYWIDVGTSRRVFDRVMTSLRAREPAMVVWVNGPPPWWASRAEFARLLEAGYVEEIRVGRIQIYRRRDGQAA